MKIRIVKASEPTYWYEDAIGKIYTVLSTDEVERKYKVDGGWYVDFEDCEEVIEHNSQLYRKVDRPVREGDTVLITILNDEVVYAIKEVTRFSIVDDKDFLVDKHKTYIRHNRSKYFVLEPIEEMTKPVQPSSPSCCAFSYAEVSELIHEATAEFNEGVDELTGKYDSTLRNLSDDIVEHNGKQYRKVKRKAAVGDLVVVTDFKAEEHSSECRDIKNGTVFTVTYAREDGQVDLREDTILVMDTEEYRVLEPIEQSGQSEKPTEVDLIANLAQEVTELKRNQEELIARMNDLGGGTEAAVVDFEGLTERLNGMADSAKEKRNKYSPNDNAYDYFDGQYFGLKKALITVKEALRNG